MLKRAILGAAVVAALSLSACSPDDVLGIALPTMKVGAVKLAAAAARGDSKARDLLLSGLDGYCDVPEAERAALRQALAGAVTVDCAAVAALRAGG